MSKLNLGYAEFYITNVCNLACPGCNRFNNYHFTGYQRWSDYQAVYETWAQEISLGGIGILGGEPLLNPTFMQWLIGINQLWPNRHLKVVTNGFHVSKVSGLYTQLRQHANIELWVGIHNKQHKANIFAILNKFLCQPVQIDHDNTNRYQEFVWITDANGVRIKVEYNWWFHQGAIVQTQTGRTLHSSDPKLAHDNCHMRTCHHFIRGKLYKCGVVALLPEFDSQHPLELSPEDRVLMNGYRALTIDDSWSTKQQFITNLDQPIDQCRFCPERYQGQQISSQMK